jgi:nanoRNase/pAp phosphatase (c-di-AMP/oligoRNAs hydrolase)
MRGLDFNRILEICNGRNVYIQTHNFPDPDAIGSAYGLQQLLKRYGIESVICHEGLIDKLSSRKMLKVCDIDMVSYNSIDNGLSDNALVILVDCQKNNGNTSSIIEKEEICIDHHPVFGDEDYRYKDIRITGACAGIVADYYRVLGETPDGNTATALLYAIKMDTLQFTRGVTSFDIDMFAYLFPFIDREKMKRLENDNMEFQDLRAYGSAIEHISIYQRIGFSYIDFECPNAMIAIMSDFILSIAGVETSVICSVRRSGLRFSVRTERDDIHAGYLANKILGRYGSGGGHASMAGGFISFEKYRQAEGLPEYSENLLIQIIRETTVKRFLQEINDPKESKVSVI